MIIEPCDSIEPEES